LPSLASQDARDDSSLRHFGPEHNAHLDHQQDDAKTSKRSSDISSSLQGAMEFAPLSIQDPCNQLLEGVKPEQS
jgi:hypothetical protein